MVATVATSVGKSSETSIVTEFLCSRQMMPKVPKRCFWPVATGCYKSEVATSKSQCLSAFQACSNVAGRLQTYFLIAKTRFEQFGATTKPRTRQCESSCSPLRTMLKWNGASLCGCRPVPIAILFSSGIFLLACQVSAHLFMSHPGHRSFVFCCLAFIVQVPYFLSDFVETLPFAAVAVPSFFVWVASLWWPLSLHVLDIQR